MAIEFTTTPLLQKGESAFSTAVTPTFGTTPLLKTGEKAFNTDSTPAFITPAPAPRQAVPKQTPVMPVDIMSSNPAPLPFVAQKETVPYNVQNLNADVVVPPIEATPQETKVSDISSRIQNLNTQLVGESAFRGDQERRQGIEALTKTQNDLQTQLKMLQNEANSIPLQLQTDATGKQSLAGLQTVTADALRRNAIQSLTVSSLLEASRGNLTTALTLVDRAVAQRFDPIREEIAANKANLDLIINDPETSRQDKERARKQKEVEDKRDRQLTLQEDNQKTIQGLALQAQQNGAPAAILTKIMQSRTVGDALTSAVGYGSKETIQSIQEYNFAVKNGYEGSFIQYQNEDANRKVSIARAGASGGNTFGLTPNQVFTATQSLKKTTATNTEAARELQRQASILNATWSRLESGAAKDLNGTSQAIITTFNKLLDPTSVVREAEYDRSSAGQALISTIQGKIAAIQQGGPGLTKQSLKELVDLGNTYAQNARVSVESANKRAQEEAKYFGLNPDFVGAPTSVTAQPIQNAFSDIQSSITTDPSTKTAYIPREVWATLGSRMDALLAEAAADGYKLLVK